MDLFFDKMQSFMHGCVDFFAKVVFDGIFRRVGYQKNNRIGRDWSSFGKLGLVVMIETGFGEVHVVCGIYRGL